MIDDPTPIRDPHVAFARALVALAREHGVGRIDATFALTGSSLFRADTWNDTRVTLGWGEGRHGASGTISMRAESSIAIAETIRASDEGGR